MPPMSVRPPVSAANSAPTSKLPVCTLMRAMLSTTRHRREKSHFVARTDMCGRISEFLIDRAAHRATVGKRTGEAGAALDEPGDQRADGGYVGGRRDALLRGAGALAQPGKVKDRHWGFDIGHGNSAGCGHRLYPAIRMYDRAGAIAIGYYDGRAPARSCQRLVAAGAARGDARTLRCLDNLATRVWRRRRRIGGPRRSWRRQWRQARLVCDRRGRAATPGTRWRQGWGLLVPWRLVLLKQG